MLMTPKRDSSHPIVNGGLKTPQRADNMHSASYTSHMNTFRIESG